MANRYNDAIKKYFRIAPALSIYKILDGGDVYFFAVRRPEVKKGEEIDPWYTINKKTLKIEGFQPHTSIKKFNAATKNEVKAFL